MGRDNSSRLRGRDCAGLHHHFRRSLARLNFNYSGIYRQFVAVSDSTYSFQRFTVDLRHDIPVYSGQMPLEPGDGNAIRAPLRAGGHYGNINFRALLIDSYTGSGHAVPFYFQPTLGGLDANANGALESYADYRFRGPDLLLFQGEIEHSIWGPFHAVFRGSEGQVGLTPGELTNSLRRSYAVGFRLRAPGFPLFTFLFAWGGHEGTHNIAFLNAQLPQAPLPASLF